MTSFAPIGDKKLEYNLYVGDLVTGKVWAEVPYNGTIGWNDELRWGGSGSLKVDCPLSNPRMVGDDRSTTRLMRGIASGPWRNIFILTLNDTCLYAGPLMTHNVKSDKPEITFGVGDIKAIIDRRIICQAGALLNPRGSAANINFVDATNERYIAQVLLLFASRESGGAGRELPIDVGPLVFPLGNIVREYLASDLGSTYEAIKKIVESNNGPDMRLKPRISADKATFGWNLEIGDPYIGDSNSSWLWDYNVNCTAIEEDSDAAKMANRVYVPGDGSDEGKIIGYAKNFSLIYQGAPALEVVASSNSQEGRNQEAVDAAAMGYIDAYKLPHFQWKIEVDPHQWPKIGQWRYGDTAQFSISDHHWIPDGTYKHRIIGSSGDSSKVSLQTLSFQSGSNIASAAV